MIDPTLIEKLYNNLYNLELDNFKVFDITLKVVSNQRTITSYINYKDLNDLLAKNPIINTNTPNKYCIVGDFAFIENIKIVNNIARYNMEYYFYKCTSDIKVKDNTQYNKDLNDFFDFDKSKYIAYCTNEIKNTNLQLVELGNARLSEYVSPCYVTPNYVRQEKEKNGF